VQDVEIPVRDTGGDGPPVLFLHGLLVDGSLWDDVVARLPEHRCLVPELPLGSHTAPFGDRSQLTPHGVVELILRVLDELGLERVTVVGNDTGGGLAQILVARAPERVERLILTPCDAFETFPPPLFKLLFLLGRTSLGLYAGIAPLHLGPARRLPIAYGKLSRRASDAQLERWIRPALRSAAIRADTAHFIRHCHRSVTLEAALKLPAFDRPVQILWSPSDPAFPFSLGERLSHVFPNATLTTVDDTYAFIPIDRPDAVVAAIQSPQPSI
jgi:pimeloyl-ACP methyl ester carboxylesterase